MGDLRKRFTESESERFERLAAEATEGPRLNEQEYTAKSRRSFLTGALAAFAGIAGFRHIQTRPNDDGVPDVLRKGYEFNETLWETLGSQSKLAPTWAVQEASSIRVNGTLGLRTELDLVSYELRVEGIDGTVLETLTFDEMSQVIGELPQQDLVVEHKCIEGWVARPHWGGTPFAGFAERYAADVPQDYAYVGMSTPDDQYYVGVDRATMLNAQSLLVTHLGGEALSENHGAPLRLATPHKYGIKSIKRIGTIRFTNDAPADYWAERGYTYWAGF